MVEDSLILSELYMRGLENLARYNNPPTPYLNDQTFKTDYDASVSANRRYLDSLYFVPRFLDSVYACTDVHFFGTNFKTPVFCSAISGLNRLSENAFSEVAKGLKNAGSMIMLGIGGSRELQEAIDSGVPVVKIVKPYRRTELIYEKLKDAEDRGCIAVGMDIDHFYGRIKGAGIFDTELFGPLHLEEMRQVVT
jgi:isopentenyl diphosphate isomerase/L-lactate dehydrogenase-like FMN-dependent dehydrogenase